MDKKSYIFHWLIGALVLSIIGFYNGYPLVYSDTGTYIYSGFNFFIPNDRPIFYGLFVRVISMKWSLWFVIITQNLMSSVIILELLRKVVLDKKIFSYSYISVLFLITVTTGFGWYTNQIMPDFATPLLIILTYLIIKFDEPINFKFISFAVLLIFFTLIHFSHLLIISFLSVFFLFKLFKERHTHTHTHTQALGF